MREQFFRIAGSDLGPRLGVEEDAVVRDRKDAGKLVSHDDNMLRPGLIA